jgi:hypothetical protein
LDQLYSKLDYLRKLKNGHSEDIINYIDYYQLYKDVKEKTSEKDKYYTVNTLVYSYNSICNTNDKKGCEKKLKFIQDMLSYMDKNDKAKILVNRNVMHVNYEEIFNEEKLISNFYDKTQGMSEAEFEKAEKKLVSASITSYEEEELCPVKPRSPVNSKEKSKIYPHYIGAINKINSIRSLVI